MKTKFLDIKNPWYFIAWIILLAFFFANVEIQIEGSNGWAASLPTWRVENHALLDIFWSGRPMTGYHVWVFSFMFLAFHLPVFACGKWNIFLESRILGALMIFWIVEDFLWFILNPAFGWAKFSSAFIPWHKHWVLGVPLDYLTFTVIGAALLWLSFRRQRK
jgi:hypothetical protein